MLKLRGVKSLAMRENHESLILNEAWIYLEHKGVPHGANGVSYKWVYRIKDDR